MKTRLRVHKTLFRRPKLVYQVYDNTRYYDDLDEYGFTRGWRDAILEDISEELIAR